MKKLLLVICVLLFSSKIFAYNPIPADKLFDAPSASQYSISPDSNYIVGYKRYNDHHYLELTEIKSLKKWKLEEFDKKLNFYGYSWIDTSNILIEYRYGKDDIKEAILSFEFKDGKLKVSIDEIKIDGSVLNPLSNVKDKVLFLKRTGDDIDDINLYFVSVQQLLSGNFKKTDKFKNTLDDAFYYHSDRDGKIQLATTFEDDSFYYWILDPVSNEWRKAHKIFNQDYKFVPVGILKSGNLIVLTNKESDRVRLSEFDVKSKSLISVIYEHPRYDLTDATLNDLKTKVESIEYVSHGKIVTEYLDSTNELLNQKLRKHFPGKQVIIGAKNDNSSLMLVHAFASDDPGSTYLFDKKDSQLKHVVDMREELKSFKLTPSQSFSVKVPGAKEIEAIFTQPKHSNGVLLVEPHGGPIGVRDFNLFSPSTQYYASRGFSVLKVNFRGSSGFGKAFQKAGQGQFGKLIEEDISAAVDKVLEAHSFKNICAMGASYGGYSAMMLGIYKPDIYDCIVAAYGVYDLNLLFNMSNLKTSEDYIKRVRAVVGENVPELANYSPFKLVREINQPLLLIAGKNDSVSGFEQSNRMKYVLNKHNKKFETLFYRDADHGHDNWFGDRHEHAFTYDFLNRTLNISPIKNSTNEKALAQDYQTLARGYYFKNYIGKDVDKSFTYTKKAAELNDPAAIFDLGSYYHRGEVVDKDTQKAIDLYKKSSQKGFGEASLRLGRLHREGVLIEKDLERSFDYFRLAEEQNNNDAVFEAADYYCSKDSDKKDITLCYEKMNKIVYTRLNNKQKNKAVKFMSDIVWHLDASTTSDKKELTKMLEKVFSIDNHNEFKLSVSKGGFFYTHWGTKNSRSIRYDRHENTKQFELRDSYQMGVFFKLRSKNNIKSKKSLIKVKWTHPEMIHPKTKEKFTERKSVIFSNLNEEVDGRYWVNRRYQRVKGKWKVEMFNVYDELLYTDEYIVY